jgi:threonine 3-dehydrogenase
VLRTVFCFYSFFNTLALHRTPLPSDIAECVISEFHFDIQNIESVKSLFTKYGANISSIWNLAAPLSVDTAKDPSSAMRVTVDGMRNVLEAMRLAGISRIRFSDSIGSFGSSSPRDNCTAGWLLDHPDQDPGSDYGIQKRLCRNLLSEYREQYGFDTRFVVIPGVLHSESTWGGGTTEYALDALMAAHRNQHYICPIPENVKLPMIYIDDLVKGMILLDRCPKDLLLEKQYGYNLSGFSFSPRQLFDEIQKHIPGFTYSFDETLNPFAATFAQLWPDSLSRMEAFRDFNFQSEILLEETVQKILQKRRYEDEAL